MRRPAVPLHKKRHAKFIKGIQNATNQDRAMSCHLGIGTGARPDTICHTHSNWFIYTEENKLYYRIPNRAPCRKFGTTDPCGDCNQVNRTEYSPKTPAGEGRRILIKNYWTNNNSGEREYFGLRDAVESYFALDGPNAPSDVQYGHEMIDGDGTTKSTYNEWVRDIGAQSGILPEFRADQLAQVDDVSPDDIRDFGTDHRGNGIPDIFAHDLRASYVTQLMRNEVPPNKAIGKTGHASPEAMAPYVMFAQGEIDPSEEESFY